MKKKYIQIIFSILFLTGIQFNSAQADDKIHIKLHQPPPNMLGAKDLWKLDIINTTSDNINIYLTGTATESKKGLIVSGKSKVFSVSPGTKRYDYNDFTSGEVKWLVKSIQETLLRTGNVGEGNYTICVTAFYEGGEVADQESCIEQSVQQLGSITLISPEDKAELDPDTIGNITFMWSPLYGAKDYTLRIIELKGDEVPPPPEAMKQRNPFYEEDGINRTVFQYPISEKKFENGKKYAWMVSSKGINSDVNTFLIIAGSVTASITFIPFGNGCCDSIYINTNENFFNSFKISVGGVTSNIISSVSSLNSTVNPSTITAPVSSVTWNSSPGGSTFQVGTHCVGSICFTNTTGPFTVVINWSTNGGQTFTGSDIIQVSCPPITPPVTQRDPCCPPWNRDIMMNMMVYHGQGSIALPYTLNFVPDFSLNDQMYQYINYINIARPTITSIIIWWGLFDPPYHQSTQIGPAAFTWWTATNTPPSNPTYADPDFFKKTTPPNLFPMQVGIWYKIRTWIYLNDDQTFFPVDQCGYNDIYVRIQKQGSVLEYSYDGVTTIKTVPIP